MLHWKEAFDVVNDNEKREGGFPQVMDAELKNLNQWWKPRKVIANDVKSGWVRFCPLQSMTRNLFSGHTTSGVKLAGMHLRRLYGTREVIARAESCKASAMQDT